MDTASSNTDLAATLAADVGERRARSLRRRSGAAQAQATAHLILVHDGVRVAARDAGVVGEPMSSFVTTEERGT
jgi:hypothetical protein